MTIAEFGMARVLSQLLDEANRRVLKPAEIRLLEILCARATAYEARETQPLGAKGRRANG